MNGCRKIKTVEELILLQSRGVKVTCPTVNYMEKPRTIENLKNLKLGSAMAMIKNGLYAVDDDEQPLEGSVLGIGREQIRALGLSQDQIAKNVGVTRQAVNKFMGAASVQTRTLDKYLTRLGY